MQTCLLIIIFYTLNNHNVIKWLQIQLQPHTDPKMTALLLSPKGCRFNTRLLHTHQSVPEEPLLNVVLHLGCYQHFLLMAPVLRFLTQSAGCLCHI